MSKWKKVKLIDVCKNIFAGGDVPKNDYSLKKDDNYSIPIYTNGEQNLGLYGYTTKARVIEPSITVSARGTIGFTAIRTAPFFPAIRLITLTPNDEIDIKYLFYVTQNYKFDNGGTSIPQLTVPMLKDYSFPLPPLETQRKIAKKLDKATHLIDICNSILEKLDLLVKARFVEMFGDPVNNNYNLPTKTLLELGELGRGVSKHRPRNSPELLGGKYPLIQTGDVANADIYIYEYKSTYSEIGFRQSKMWNKGTLCITIAANIAKTAILTFDSCFPDSVVGFNANDMTTNLYIYYWFTFFQSILEEQAPESAQKNINLKILSELKVTVPPIELQNQFTSFVEQTERLKLAVKQVLERAETLKKALMQEYFE